MIVLVGAAAVILIPDVFYLGEGLGLDLVHAFHQKLVHLFTVAHPLRGNLQGFIKQVIVAGNDVDKVAYTPGSVVCPIQMDMDTTGAVYKTTCFT